MKNDVLDRLEGLARDALERCPELLLCSDGAIVRLNGDGQLVPLANGEAVVAMGAVRSALVDIHAALAATPRRKVGVRGGVASGEATDPQS